MARHVPFDIAIGCISRLLDSVFFIMAADYRNTYNHSWRGTTFVIFISSGVQYAVDFFASILLVRVNTLLSTKQCASLILHNGLL
jgi:hypothetical protein